MVELEAPACAPAETARRDDPADADVDFQEIVERDRVAAVELA